MKPRPIVTDGPLMGRVIELDGEPLSLGRGGTKAAARGPLGVAAAVQMRSAIERVGGRFQLK